MIGNDIVDLKAAGKESNWRRRGFLEKIFTEEERKLILQSSDPEQLVWLLWSMKEAAYKAHQREFQLPRRYNPKIYAGTLIFHDRNSASGLVKAEGGLYFSQSNFEQDYIYTTASYSEDEKIFSRILPSSENLKSSFISKVSQVINACNSKISLTKDERFIPVLSNDDEELNCPFSLSHHGKFSAYCLSLTNY